MRLTLTVLLGSVACQGAEHVHMPVHVEVTRASQAAIEAIEKAGGTVTCAHFNRLALRALLKPHKFDTELPRRARPPPKLMPFYLDYDRRGYLSPEVQMRNKQLFGHVTSEETLSEEHKKTFHDAKTMVASADQ